MNNAKFIKTTDVEIAKQLRELGCVELQTENKLFVFVNPTKLNFSIDKSRVQYSNVLSF